jgi:ribA/ribD-fused uncharacterized protein
MINQFKDEYRFLSNFWMCPVQYEGYIYPSSEHAYMAAKTTDGIERRYIANLLSPIAAKAYGRQMKLRDGWEQMKYAVMLEILLDKFKRNTRLTQLLLDTGDQQLVEGNWWGDKIWGVCLKTNQGENNLGKTLMQVRSLLQPKPVRLIIAGGRDFTDEALVRERLMAMEELNLFPTGVVLICGMAKGADALGLKVFTEAGLDVHAYHPDWEGLGKRAGFVRNAQMGDAADMALIFWDGHSRGTKHMIQYMEKLGKPVYLVNY